MMHKPSAVPINTSEKEVELQDRNAELAKRRRTGFSGSIVQPQQESEVSDMEKNVPDGLPVEVSTGDDPMAMDVLTDCALQNSCEANGHSEGRVRSISFTGNEPASLRLRKICAAIGCKEPSFDFEKQGPPHNILFTCKVSVCLEGFVNTVIECLGDPKPKEEDTQEHAAQGALWCLERFGHTKQS